MFPTSLEHPYAPRGRRRGRNDPNSRDYICPCGKSYLSYPALFTHIKIKHNGRAPGQIIKPKTQSLSKRGRPRQKQVYDSQSDTNDIAANCIDRICDFVTDFDKPDQSQARKIKQLYMKDPFYTLFVNFNPQEQQLQYNQREDLYEQYCDNVFCEVIVQVTKRINDPYYVDTIIVYFMKLAHFIDTSSLAENAVIQRHVADFQYGQYQQNLQQNGQNEQQYQDEQNLDQEQQILEQDQQQIQQQILKNENELKQDEKIYEQNRQNQIQNQYQQQKMQQKQDQLQENQRNQQQQYGDQVLELNQGIFLKLKQQSIRNIVNFVNNFILDYTSKYEIQNDVKQYKFFDIQNIKLFTQLFFQWLTIKKYIGYKVKINKGWK